ncbi:MAG: Gfo/Idh/MocA family oxidoreductase [Pseudomonadota bacterium]|nr:Gfo/Idh/MocA family oxidoreductase [Pseudomonadota bacterium]
MTVPRERYVGAVIGTGRIGMLHERDPLRLKPATHFGMMKSHPRISFAAICDAEPEKFDIARSMKPDIACYTDPKKMLEEVRPDIVAIATWRDTHYQMMKLALAAGVRVIICEKPIAESDAHAKEVVQQARKQGVELLINHRRRFDPLLYSFRDDLQNGIIGEIVQVHSIYVYGLLTTGTHMVDALRFFLNPVAGEIVWVAGYPNVMNHLAPADDPNVDAVLGFENGLKVFMQSSNIQDYDIFDFTFYGRAGMAHFYNIGRNIDIYKVMSSPEHEGFTEPSREPEERRGGKPRDLFTHMADNAIDCIEGRATSLSTGEDSLKTLEILLAIQQSAAGNGRRIDLD